jgi:hypothetical protein
MEASMLSPDRIPDLALPEAAADYAVVRRAMLGWEAGKVSE